MADSAKGEGPQVGQDLAPKATHAPPLYVRDRTQRSASPSPTARLEAMVDRHIVELKADKASLQAELRAVRSTEITHLRDDVRWLEGRVSSLQGALTALRTSYEWAVSFNWFSTATVIVGGACLGIAAFLPTPRSPDWLGWQTIFATAGLVLQIIGMIVQAFLSHRGARTLRGLDEADQSPSRPPPSPEPPDGEREVGPP